MKKIHTLLTQHPKLKRATKILGVIGIVLSFLFNAVIIASAIITANNNEVKQPLVYEQLNQPVKPMAENPTDTKTHYFLGLSDLQFNTFYNNLVRLYGDSARFTNNSTFTYSTTNGDFNLDSVDFCYYESDMLEYNTAYDITSIEVSKYFGTINQQTYVGYSIYFRFVMNNVNSTLVFVYLVIPSPEYFGQNFSGYILNTDSYLNSGGTIIRSGLYQYYFADYYLNGGGIFYDLFIYNQDKGYLEGYSDGWATGYNTAWDSGYASGYYDGVEHGISEQMSTNPFNLISQAFSSIASILNIELLPNFPLGILIFTPLIITIIIVVVKFIRG